MPLVIEHSFEIDASAETVWQVITDFGRYNEWNPFIVGCSCDLAVGNDIVMQVVLGEGKAPRSQTETISELEPGKHFAYTSPKNPTFLLRSYRSHTVTSLPEGKSRYQSRFALHGWLSPLLGLLLGASLRWGFEAMAQGIVRQSESEAQSAKNPLS